MTFINSQRIPDFGSPFVQPAPPPPPASAQAWPRGDGSFSAQAAGTTPQPALDHQFALMANDTYDADNPRTEQQLSEAGWTRLEASADGSGLLDAAGNAIPIDPALLETGTGFAAAIFQNADGAYVVAFRGTDDWSPAVAGDADDNALQSLGFETGQYRDAITLAQRAEQVFGEGNVAVTGHSLGGGLASAAALATGATGVTFNAAGLSNETLDRLGFNPNAARASAADSGQVRRYAVNGDPLTAAQEDLPTLPIVGSPPDAIGYALRIDAPAGLGFDLIALHGGGGDGASYVDALAQNTAYDPATRPTPSESIGGLVDSALDALGDGAGAVVSGLGNGADRLLDGTGDILRANPLLAPGAWVLGTALDGTGAAIRTIGDGAGAVINGGLDLLGDGAGATIGFVGNVGGDAVRHLGELNFNLIGDGARAVTGVVQDVAGNVDHAADGIATAIADDYGSGDYVKGTFNIAGDLLNAGIDSVGDAASGLLEATGDGVDSIGQAGGGMLRDLGDRTGLAAPFDAVAGVVEGAGSVVGDLAEGAAGLVDRGSDLLGDGAEVVTDFVGNVGEGIADGARVVGDGIAESARAVGNGIAEGARAVGERLDPRSWF